MSVGLEQSPAGSARGGADLGPGLGRDFPLRLELVVNPSRGEEDPEPFVVLSDMGRNSRVYLGRIRAGNPAADRFVAVKMQTPRPAADQPEDVGGLLTHRVRERRWQRELEHYHQVQNVKEGFTPVLFVEPAPERSEQPPQPRPWPALLYCNEQQVFFQPLSERGTALVTCRDDQLLASLGLAGYDETAETYLYNKEDIEAGSPPSLYQPTREGEPIHPSLKTFDSLLKSQAEIPGLPGAPSPPMNSPEAIQTLARLSRTMACLTCPKREDCYGQDLYPKRLEPFAFEDTNALVLELNRFHYDEFCDLLGRTTWKAFQKDYMGPGAGTGQIMRLTGTEALIQDGRRYLFDSDGSGMDALEIFKLKWTLFTQIAKALMEYHKRTGVAHLRIEPRHVMIRLDGQGDYLPTMWEFRTRLISLGSMPLETKSAEGEKEELLALPLNSNPAYDAEIIRNSSFGVVQRGGFILKGIDPAGEGKFSIKAEIHHDGIGMPWMSPKDRVKVMLRNVVGLPPNLTFMCLLDAEQEFSQMTLYVKSHPIALTQQQADALKRIYGVKIHNAGFVLYPLFHIPCDLFSLGVLMFRTLAVNDRQGIGDVSLALEQVKQEMKSLAQVECEAGQEVEFLGAILEGQRRKNLSETFDRRQVFHQEADRAEDRPNAIPKNLWAEAMILGLQLVTQIEGFSFAINHGDYDPRYPAGKMELVVRRCEEILRKIDTELLALSRRNAEIRAAIDSVAAEGAK